jgi:hypothetical protein
MKKALLLISIFLLPTFLQACSDEDDNQRCQAITKDQCKRNAEKGSIYCWQHKK